MHAGGTDTFIHTMCDRLSEANYVAAAPDLYHRLGINDTRSPRTLKDLEMIADVEATVAFLNDHPRVDNTTGFCMGGRVAYPAAIPGFKAAVAYYGGNTMTALGENIPSPFERTADIACPLMFHFGEADQNPSPEDMKILDTELPATPKNTNSSLIPTPATLSWTLPALATTKQATAHPGPEPLNFSTGT